MRDNALLAEVLGQANRADPYPLYARLRGNPISRDKDGTYIVSTYAEIRNLLQDARLSSEDLPNPKYAKTGNPLRDFILNPVKGWIIKKHRPLIFRDPPDHTILRRLITVQFTPERVRTITGRVDVIIDDLIGKLRGREEIDLVKDFCYPLPVTVICELLGIPPSDASKFQSWSTTLAGVLDPDRRQTTQRPAQIFGEIVIDEAWYGVERGRRGLTGQRIEQSVADLVVWRRSVFYGR